MTAVALQPVGWAESDTATATAERILASGDHAPAFWDERPELKLVREWARQRLASPWSVLGCTLVRAIMAVPPSVRIPAMIGSPSSLNMNLAVVGMSGKGKSISSDIAAELLDVSESMELDETGDVHTVPVGTGEGLVSQFGHLEAEVDANGKRDPHKQRYVQDRVAVLFTADEIDSFMAQAGKPNETLTSQIRIAWTATKALGFGYRTEGKAVQPPAHTYRLCLITGAQPENSQGLMARASGGLPQRFLWLPASDPDAVMPTHDADPERLILRDFRWPAHRIELAYPREAWNEVRQNQLASLRGETPDDERGHLLLCKCKVAAALALLAGRRHIDLEDWQLAEVVIQVSERTRLGIIAHLGEVQAKSDHNRAVSKGIVADVQENSREEHQVRRVSRSVLEKLSNDAWTPHAKVRRSLAGRDRPVFERAIEALGVVGQIEWQKNDGEGLSYRRRPT